MQFGVAMDGNKFRKNKHAKRGFSLTPVRLTKSKLRLTKSVND